MNKQRWITTKCKRVISQNIVFKNGSKVVPFNDVFDKFVVSNLSGFPCNSFNTNSCNWYWNKN